MSNENTSQKYKIFKKFIGNNSQIEKIPYNNITNLMKTTSNKVKSFQFSPIETKRCHSKIQSNTQKMRETFGYSFRAKIPCFITTDRSLIIQSTTTKTDIEQFNLVSQTNNTIDDLEKIKKPDLFEKLYRRKNTVVLRQRAINSREQKNRKADQIINDCNQLSTSIKDQDQSIRQINNSIKIDAMSLIQSLDFIWKSEEKQRKLELKKLSDYQPTDLLKINSNFYNDPYYMKSLKQDSQERWIKYNTKLHEFLQKQIQLSMMQRCAKNRNVSADKYIRDNSSKQLSELIIYNQIISKYKRKEINIQKGLLNRFFHDQQKQQIYLNGKI